MATGSIEERLAVVENELSQLKKQLEGSQSGPEPYAWWREWFGAFQDDPVFDSAMEKGAAYRRAQRTADQDED